jgi:hypothetical protein
LGRNHFLTTTKDAGHFPAVTGSPCQPPLGPLCQPVPGAVSAERAS